MSERARLLGRQLPPTTFTLRVEHTPDADAAFDELEAARRAVSYAEARGEDPAPHTARVAAAEVAVAPFCMRLLVRVLPADRFEQLELDHPPSKGEVERGLSWNVATYIPALLEACVDGDMAADDWAELRVVGGHVAAGEINALVNVCLRVNDRSPDIALGKG